MQFFDGSPMESFLQHFSSNCLASFLQQSGVPVTAQDAVFRPHLYNIIRWQPAELQQHLKLYAIKAANITPTFLDGSKVVHEFGNLPVEFVAYVLSLIRHERMVIPFGYDSCDVFRLLCLFPVDVTDFIRAHFRAQSLNSTPKLRDGELAMSFVVSVGYDTLRKHLEPYGQHFPQLVQSPRMLALFCTTLQPDVIDAIRTTLLRQKTCTPYDYSQKRYKPHDCPSWDDHYLRPIDEAVIRGCTIAFIDATNNKALAQAICVVCARESFRSQLKELPPHALPNIHQLAPATPNRHHRLYRGQYLLHHVPDDARSILVCCSCLADLEANSLPALSLANDMWIGDVPPSLACLTLAERVLVSRYFPAAYIVKLYPKGVRGMPHNQLNDGLCGNVSSYPLPIEAVAKFIDGTDRRMLPPPPSILAAIIGVTFIKANKKVCYPFPKMLCVSRRRVHNALLTLREINPCWHDIEISNTNLILLPDKENTVPTEIIAIARESYDLAAVQHEHSGYVPDLEDDDCDSSNTGKSAFSIHIFNLSTVLAVPFSDGDIELEPVVDENIPFTYYGSIDASGDTVLNDDLREHAIGNALCPPQQYRDDRVKVRASKQFVNEYGRVDSSGNKTDGGPSNPNHLLGSFPILFPYGAGGFETSRRIDVPYETHVRWALQYGDRRFRKDIYFAFQVFGVLQKRKICSAAAMKVNAGYYKVHEAAILSLNPRDLLTAAAQENRRTRFTNPAVQALRDEVTAVRAKVEATDESRQTLRSKIWSTNLLFNPPTFWLTINPSDQQDPIAQVLAGHEIDLDRFVAASGPDSATRRQNIASDQYASAQYFHVIIHAFLSHLLGIKKEKTKLIRKRGILGYVQAYIGTVEAQGRGSLHLHVLLWTVGTPAPAVLAQKLCSSAFREQVRSFISANIYGDVDGKECKEVLEIPKDPNVSYSRPIDPRSSTYENDVRCAAVTRARTLQVHRCSNAICLITVNGRKYCTRRLPFTRSGEAWVTQSGEWGPFRPYPYVNNYNPTILNTIRSNHDLKLLLHSADAAHIVWYITKYAAKHQTRNSNVSAILARTLSFFQKSGSVSSDVHRYNKQLIQRCCTAVGRLQEFSSAEVFSYLMNWGDRYVSHTYQPIYIRGIIACLKDTFPSLRTHIIGHRDQEDEHSRDCCKLIPLQVVNGHFKKSDQLSEYADRGIGLHHLNFLDFTLQTYDQVIPADITNTKCIRTTYDKGTGRDDRCRVTRLNAEVAEVLPNIIGGWFPRVEQQDGGELHYACILTFLKPWKTPIDIVSGFPSFEASYCAFMAMNPALRDVVDNINYFHIAQDGAKKSRKSFTSIDEILEDLLPSLDTSSLASLTEGDELEVSEADIEYARLARTSPSETHFALMTIADAERLGFFAEDEDLLSVTFKSLAAVASEEEAQHYEQLFNSLKGLVAQHLYIPQNVALPDNGGLEMSTDDISQPRSDSGEVELELVSQSSTRPLCDSLRSDQAFAHSIVEDHLQDQRSGRNPDQLLMMVMGPGGTGKTVFIKALRETFVHYGMPEHALVTTATSGIAASLTGGCTIHSWAGLPRRRTQSKTASKPMTKTKKPTPSEKKRSANITPTQYLVIDEISMLSHYDFCQLSDICGITKAQSGAPNAQQPFGGINIILCGDFHQFPPVSNPKGALYMPPTESASDMDKRGFELYQQFEDVVLLHQQLRVTDHPWTIMLQHLRNGECDAAEIEMVKSLILGSPKCPPTDWNSDFWRHAVLITSRNSARKAWNAKSIRKHAAATRNRVYRVAAEDTRGRLKEALCLKERLAIAQMSIKATAPLEDVLELVVGMKAMVTVNISPKDDLANGSRGTVEDIVLDPRESADDLKIDDEGIVTLEYPPAVILFRPDDAHAVPTFASIPHGLLPITPSEQTFHVNYKHAPSFQVNRRQFAVTPAYALTHYKGQGQTLHPVIIDIADPPGNLGKIDNFSAYVALSRGKGRDSVRLLRGFDESVMTSSPPFDLLMEDQRLERLAKLTKVKYSADNCM